jgi:type IV pilus assembly protein PilY1
MKTIDKSAQFTYRSLLGHRGLNPRVCRAAWLAVLVLLAFSFLDSSAEAAYGYRQAITINAGKVSGSQTNFPVLVSIPANAGMKTAANGGHVQNSNGYDIVFRAADGTTQFAHEVERYVAVTGEMTAWVKVPAIQSTGNTLIYVYYGDSSVSSSQQNATAVWDSNFMGVWHLNSNNFKDSTSNPNPNNGTDSGTSDVTGQMANGRNFDATTDRISVGASTTLQPASLTYSFWVRRTAAWTNLDKVLGYFKGAWDGNGWYLDSYDVGNANRPLNLMVNGTNYFAFSSGTDPDAFYPSNTWTYIVVTFNSSTRTATAYKNNTSLTVSSSGTPTAISTTADTKYLSCRSPDSTSIIGNLDEVRVSNTVRSASWIATEYNNQSSPSTFHTIGAEENIGGPVLHQITALAGTNGSISPSPSVMVVHGSSQAFTVTVNTGYQVSQVLVDGLAAVLTSGKYTFSNVAANHQISVAFTPTGTPDLPPGPPIDVPGCSMNVNVSYGNTGFVASAFDLTSVDVTPQNTLFLNTGYYAIDPNRIVIPFTQAVAVTFFYENAAFSLNDFGWVLASDGKDAVKDATKRHVVYTNINDNNNNGILDDREGTGVNANVNRVDLGTFQAGTEIVFWLHWQSDNYSDNNYFFTKKDWNSDTYDSTLDGCASDTFTKTYLLGETNAGWAGCKPSNGWMDAAAVTRLKNTWGLDFKDATSPLTYTRGQKFSHVVTGAPLDKPNEWILGWEDWPGGLDTDLNDFIFHIERRTGGRAELKNPIVPAVAEAYYTGVTATVYDYMPCAGKTDLKYYVSIDKGANWVEITNWDEMWESNASKGLVLKLASWTPGTPPYTMKKVRIDFAGRGLTGRELVWKADFISGQQGCEPQVLDVILDADVASHGNFSRGSPVVKANMLYSGYYETPAASWRDKSLRGHLSATRLYAPADPSKTDPVLKWEAGAVLTARDPATRVIYYPQIAVGRVTANPIGTGDGTALAFSGKLSPAPIATTTLSITDGRETFTDQHTSELKGNLGGRGTINRFTGEFSLNFNTAPFSGASIEASYQYYATAKDLNTFTVGNVDKQLLGLDDSEIIPSGYVYDFDRDNDVDDNDAHWLMNWVRGYELGTTIKREWLLDPVDHSVPALLTAPGRPLWYFGTATTKDEQKSFDQFADAYNTRRAVIFAGSRSGMLHAFDAGAFRYGENPCTTGITEKRGYFEWDSACASGPDYGTGAEKWAFIPANLMPRLKNNLLSEMNQTRSTDYDQAYVDASPALADVYIGGAWRTVLLSAEGNGGDTVFCLDVTDPESPKFMWEFADPDLFRSRSSPSVAKIGRIVKNGKPKWVAFFVSGNDDRYDRTQFPSVYMIDIETGAVLERIFLSADTGGRGGVPSGQPAIVDSDGNGYIDRFYIGTDKGFMYKVNIPDDPDTVKYDVSQCVVNRDYTDATGAEVTSAWRYQPIYGSPVVSVNNTVNENFSLNYKVRIFYGTGDSPYYKDDINTESTRYHFLAYEDTAAKGVCNESLATLDWFYELPKGHRVFASAFAAAGTIYFGTSTAETEDPCESDSLTHNGGEIFAFDMKDPRNDAGKVVPKLQVRVGNVVAPPVVYDQHLFYKSFDGQLTPHVMGEAGWNTETISVPNGVEVMMWREVF